MADLTAPFFGNPQATAQGVAGRKQLAKAYEDTWLDEVIQGIFGKEESSGSVLQEGREGKVRGNIVGQTLGAIAGVAAPLNMALGMKVAAPVLSALKESQRGAIRVGGAKDLYATHAFNPHAAEGIMQSGKLDAPSIGIVSRAPNDYGPSQPQFIFRAGALDSNKQVGTLVNRDGYFSNPRMRDHSGGWHDPGEQANIIRAMVEGNKADLGIPDLRLGQSFPGQSQGLSIGASPAFKSFEEFEKSPFGAKLLRAHPKDRGALWNDLEIDLLHSRAEGSLPAREIVKGAHEYGLASLSPAERDMWERAQRLPSAMAEFKILQPLDLNPADAFVHLPGNMNAPQLQELNPLRDAGFKFVTAPDLASPGLAKAASTNPNMPLWFQEVYKNMPNLVPPDGTMRLPKTAPAANMQNPYQPGNSEQFLDWLISR